MHHVATQHTKHPTTLVLIKLHLTMLTPQAANALLIDKNSGQRKSTKQRIPPNERTLQRYYLNLLCNIPKYCGYLRSAWLLPKKDIDGSFSLKV